MVAYVVDDADAVHYSNLIQTFSLKATTNKTKRRRSFRATSFDNQRTLKETKQISGGKFFTLVEVGESLGEPEL